MRQIEVKQNLGGRSWRNLKSHCIGVKKRKTRMGPQHFCLGEWVYGSSRRKFGKKDFKFGFEVVGFEVCVIWRKSFLIQAAKTRCPELIRWRLTRDMFGKSSNMFYLYISQDHPRRILLHTRMENQAAEPYREKNKRNWERVVEMTKKYTEYTAKDY